MGTTEDFRQFMACVISVEDLQKLSSQSLVDFQQNLDIFRREPLQGKSDLIAHLLDVAPSARLTRYLEAGSLHEDSARKVVIKLFASRLCLERTSDPRQARYESRSNPRSIFHRYGVVNPKMMIEKLLDLTHNFVYIHAELQRAQTLLIELENLVKKNSDLMLSTLCTNLENVEISPPGTEDEEDPEAHQQSSEPRFVHRRPQASDYVHVMALILSMLVEDFKMQEKIVNALGLDTKMEALQSYSLMWTLRPYVDDLVIEQALNWIN